MRLVLIDVDPEAHSNFYPLSLSRPVWELRCGMTTLAEKLRDKTGAADVAGFLPDYMAAAYRESSEIPVNDVGLLAGDDLLLIDACVKAASFDVPATGKSEVGVDEGLSLIHI